MWSFDAPYHVVKVWRLLKKSNFHDFFGQKSIPPQGWVPHWLHQRFFFTALLTAPVLERLVFREKIPVCGPCAVVCGDFEFFQNSPVCETLSLCWRDWVFTKKSLCWGFSLCWRDCFFSDQIPRWWRSKAVKKRCTSSKSIFFGRTSTPAIWDVL